MSMFCYQCEQTARGTACDQVGVCGKDAETAALQDLLVYAVEGISQYAHRAGIEGTVSQGIRISGLRYSRYIGLAKTHLQHVLTAAAMNLVRVVCWLEEKPLAQTRTSAFVQLHAVPT